MDLSPGTRTRPRSGEPGAALRSGFGDGGGDSAETALAFGMAPAV
jgi:hypothetical protein